MASAALFAGFDRAPITEGPLERHLFDEVINVCLVSLSGPAMANGLDISILPTASQPADGCRLSSLYNSAGKFFIYEFGKLKICVIFQITA